MKLVDHWRMIWWRRASTWLAGLNAIFVGYVFSQPILLIGLIGFVPHPGVQLLLIVGSALAAFVLPVLVAHVKQPKLAAKIEKVEADG